MRASNVTLEQHRPSHSIMDLTGSQLPEPSNRSMIPAYVNPARKTSTALSRLLRDNSTPSKSKKSTYVKTFKEMLTHGENPNQVDEKGISPLWWAIVYFDNKILELLLTYGANPFTTPQEMHMEKYHPKPAIEYARLHERADKFNLIVNTFTRPTRALKNPQEQPLKLIKTELGGNSQQVVSSFHFSKASISTRLIKASRLTDTEKQSLFRLFAQHFEGNNLEKIFNDDLSGNNKLVDLIYDGTRLIGFNLFEIIHPRVATDHLVLHCVYALVEPEYRGFGLMSLLTFRLAYAMQLLAPDLKINIFFNSIHPNSYRMVCNNIHYPKYQPEYMDALIEDVLQQAFHGQPEFYHDTMTCYVKDDVRVKDTARKESGDLNERFFYQELLGWNDPSQQSETRGAPIMYYVEEKSFSLLEESSARIGLDFSEHIHRLSLFLRPLVSEHLRHRRHGTPTYLSQNDILFWNAKSVPARPFDNASPLIRARL